MLLGTRSSFFFIGPASEALADMTLVGQMAKLCVTLASKRQVTADALRRATCDIGQRTVVRQYVRDAVCGVDETVILVAGNEFGAFWTREEYLVGKEALRSARENADAT